jgi:hypothetical protein
VAQMLNPDAGATTIIRHPDVKRMLLWMKSNVEGMRVLAYMLARYQTMEKYSTDEKIKREATALSDFLRPVHKAGNTDMAVMVASEAIQVYGGYGYCSDYPVEQLLRDAKITTIYEGTNGIQAMDFAMRKLMMDRDHYNYGVFKKRVTETLDMAAGIADEHYIEPVQRGLARLDEVFEMMKGLMAEGKFLHLFAMATPLQQAMHMLVLAWCHLWALTVAVPAYNRIIGNVKGKERETLLMENREAAYYSGRVLSAQYYIGAEFMKYFGRIDYLLSGESAVTKASEYLFTGAPLE